MISYDDYYDDGSGYEPYYVPEVTPSTAPSVSTYADSSSASYPSTTSAAASRDPSNWTYGGTEQIYYPGSWDSPDYYLNQQFWTDQYGNKQYTAPTDWLDNYNDWRYVSGSYTPGTDSGWDYQGTPGTPASYYSPTAGYTYAGGLPPPGYQTLTAAELADPNYIYYNLGGASGPGGRDWYSSLYDTTPNVALNQLSAADLEAGGWGRLQLDPSRKVLTETDTGMPNLWAVPVVGGGYRFITHQSNSIGGQDVNTMLPRNRSDYGLIDPTNSAKFGLSTGNVGDIALMPTDFTADNLKDWLVYSGHVPGSEDKNYGGLLSLAVGLGLSAMGLPAFLGEALGIGSVGGSMLTGGLTQLATTGEINPLGLALTAGLSGLGSLSGGEYLSPGDYDQMLANETVANLGGDYSSLGNLASSDYLSPGDYDQMLANETVADLGSGFDAPLPQLDQYAAGPTETTIDLNAGEPGTPFSTPAESWLDEVVPASDDYRWDMELPSEDVGTMPPAINPNFPGEVAVPSAENYALEHPGEGDFSPGFDSWGAPTGPTAGTGSIFSGLNDAFPEWIQDLAKELGTTPLKLALGAVTLAGTTYSSYKSAKDAKKATDAANARRDQRQQQIDNPGTGPYGYSDPGPLTRNRRSPGVTTTYGQSAAASPLERLFYDTVNPRRAAKGGKMPQGLSAMSMPSQFANQMVQGPGGGQDDLVPAMLSPNEYVFDAETVSQLGDGNPEVGAQRLDEMRAALRRHKRAAPANKIPPKAKHPLQYMKGAA